MIPHDGGMFRNGFARGKNLPSAGTFTLRAIFQLTIAYFCNNLLLL